MNPAPSSSAWKVGRGLVLLAALIYGVVPGLIDLFTPQHLGDPDWIGHPRFHLLWQIFLVAYLGLRAFWLAWQAASPRRYDLIRASANHGLIVLGAFATAGVLAGPLGAAFGAPDEVVLGVPFPVIHFTVAGLLLLAGTLLCRSARQDAAGASAGDE